MRSWLLFLFSLTWYLSGFAQEAAHELVDVSLIYQTGHLQAMQGSLVEYTRVNLQVVLEGDFATVNCSYQLVNRGTEPLVKLGFPIEVAVVPGVNTNTAQAEMLPGLAIASGTSVLTPHNVPQTLTAKDAEGYPLRRVWKQVQLQLAPGQSAPLTLRYRVKCRLQDEAPSDSYFERYSPRRFRFKLALPPGCAANTSYSLQLDVRPLLQEGVLPHIGGAGRAVDGLYTTQLKPDAAPLLINYAVQQIRLGAQFVNYHFDDNHLANLVVSSTRAENLNPIRLFDADANTAWAPKGEQPVGQYVSFELKGVSTLTLALLNGHYKTPELYEQYGRIKELHLVCEPLEGASERIDKKITLGDLPYTKLTPGTYASRVQLLQDGGLTPCSHWRVKLTILSVYPGTLTPCPALAELFVFN